ncbi:MAG: DUF3857 domain-containing protein [Balneolaceae bacterium]|nr:DUF3857 domain-containing protein [Balneolaceae bacterium]
MKLQIQIGCMAVVMLFSGLPEAGAQAGQGEAAGIPQAEFGSIPDSLFEMRAYGPDPSAPYIYAFKEVEISFEEEDKSIVALLDYHVRIKVFDGEAKEASVIAIPYYFQNGIEAIGEIRGYTYQPDGSRAPLRPGNIRTINLNARYNVKEFTMPEVQDGSVIEYAYRVKRRYIEELPDFHLSHQAPTAVVKATIRYPRYLRYDVVPVDFSGRVRHVEQRIDTSSVPKVFSIPQPEPLVVDHWIARNVPAVKEEAFISSIDDYRGKLKFQLKEFGIPRQRLENSWELVVARIRREQDPWSVIDRHERARRLGEEVARTAGTLEQAQDSIFRYLNDAVRFSEARGSFSTTEDDSVLVGKPVSQPAINQTLVAMLEGAGINAWPLLISSRPYGRINRTFPSYFQFNGQIVYSEIGGTGYFMDASYSHSYPGLLPVESYNETGLVLKKNSYEWIEIRPSNSIFSIRIDVAGSLNRDGDLQGHISASHYGYPAQLIREKSSGGGDAESIVREALFDGYTGIRLVNSAILNLEQYGDTVKLDSDFRIENYATSFTDALEYRPMVVGYLMSNPFGDGRRDLPVTLDAPEKLDLYYSIELPDGFTLGEGSQNRAINLPGASLQEEYRSGRQSVRYEFHIDIDRKQFEPELYPQLLDLYERWVDLSNMSWQIKSS